MIHTEMKFKLFILIPALILTLSSCQDNGANEKGISYTEYIANKTLVSSVVESFTNGQDKSVIYIVEGDELGDIVKEVHYFEDGKVQVEGTLKQKKRHGKWTFYHDNGKIWSTGNFDMGKSVGVFEIFNKEGQIKIKSYYENDEKVKEDYYSNGEFLKSVDL